MVHFKRTTKNSTVSWNNVTPGAELGDMLWQYCLRNNFTLKKFFVDLPYHIVSSYSSLTVFVAFVTVSNINLSSYPVSIEPDIIYTTTYDCVKLPYLTVR
jgi:hypothetical protein